MPKLYILYKEINGRLYLIIRCCTKAVKVLKNRSERRKFYIRSSSDCSINFLETNPHIILEQCNKLPSWHRVTDSQKEQYQLYHSEPLKSLSRDIENCNIDIDSGYDAFVSIVNNATELTIPRNAFNTKTKPY